MDGQNTVTINSKEYDICSKCLGEIMKNLSGKGTMIYAEPKDIYKLKDKYGL